MKLCTVVGARPQFVKAAVVSRAIKTNASINELIIHTGQHYDGNMSDVFFEDLDIPKPHFNLGIGGGSHGENTGRMIEQIERVLMQERPDWLLVYGDTDSTLAGALAAAKLHIPIAHVEAGLRSFNRAMPEEINRLVTDTLSTRLFTPTDTATHNLVCEGITGEKVIQVGDVMQDAALFYKDKARAVECLTVNKEFILCTIHRAENTDSPARLKQLFQGLTAVAQEMQVIMPLHPRTKKLAEAANINLAGLTLIDPVGYLQMVWLLKECTMVLTDSGGLQKEAFFFAKPCVTVRDETEWVELLDCGANQLTPADAEQLILAVHTMKSKTVRDDFGLYGGGLAAHKIVNTF